MVKKEQIIKDAFKFTSARYISQGLGFFTAIALRRFLGPFYMGMWSLLKVLLGYVAYLFMGVDQGALNKIPLYAGQGDEKAEGEVRNNLFGFMLLVSVAAAIVLFAAAVCLRHVYPREVIFGLYVLSAYVILENMCAFYQLLLRTKHNFSVLSKSIIFESAVNLILILLLVRNFKIYGLYIAIVLTALLNILFMRVLARYRIRFNLNMRRLFDLARTGFPITIVGLLQWALASLDRIMIAGMIGVTFVGYYSIPVMAKNYISQLSGFGTVLYPRLMEAYGKRQNVEDIKKYAIIPPMINAYILPVVLGIMFFVGPLLIKKILPQFSPGILAMQILLLSMFFESSRVQAFHFIVAMKKQVRVIPLVVGAIILNAVGNYMFIKKGYGIYGVAWATSIVTFLSFVVMQSYAMKHFARAREIFQFIVKIVFPLVYTVAAVLLLEKYIVIRNAYLEVIIKSCSLVFLSAPLFIYINKVTGIITLLYSILKDKIFEKFSGSIAFRDEEVRESGHGKYDIVFWAHSNNETDRYLPLLAGLKERGIKALLFYKQFKAEDELCLTHKRVIEKLGLELKDYSFVCGKDALLRSISRLIDAINIKMVKNKLKGLRSRILKKRLSRKTIEGLVKKLGHKINVFDFIHIDPESGYPYGSFHIKEVSKKMGIRNLAVPHGTSMYVADHLYPESIKLDYDKIFVSDGRYKKCLEKSHIEDGTEVKALGDPRFDSRWKDTLKEISRESNALSDPRFSCKSIILLYLCPNLEQIRFDSQKYQDLVDMAQMTKGLSNGFLLIKPHPRYRNENFIKKAMKRAGLKDYAILADDPIIAYADKVDFVISSATSALFDFLPEYHDKVLIYDNFMKKRGLRNLYEGYVRFFEDYTDMSFFLQVYSAEKKSDVKLPTEEKIPCIGILCNRMIAGGGTPGKIVDSYCDILIKELEGCGEKKN